MKKSTKFLSIALMFFGLSAFAQIPVASFTSSPAAPCQGGTVQLTSTSTNTGAVTASAYSLTGAATATVLGPNAVVTFTASGSQTVILVLFTGTVPVGSATNIINVLPSPTVSIASSNTLACPFSSVTLTASVTPAAGNTYSWIAPATGTLSSTTVTVYPVTSFTVVVTGSNSCKTSATYNQALAGPSTSISVVRSLTAAICAGESNTFVASGTGTSFTWTPGPTVSATAVVSPTTTTVYTLSVGYSVCPGVTTSYTLTQQVSPCTGIQQNVQALSFGLYPNPTTGDVTIQLTGNTVKTIQVMDFTGRIVLSNTTSDEKVNMNLSALAKGIYYVRVQSNNTTEVSKLIKE